MRGCLSLRPELFHKFLAFCFLAPYHLALPVASRVLCERRERASNAFRVSSREEPPCRSRYQVTVFCRGCGAYARMYLKSVLLSKSLRDQRSNVAASVMFRCRQRALLSY